MNWSKPRDAWLIPALLASPVLLLAGYLAFNHITRNSLWAINNELVRKEIPRVPASAVVLGRERGSNLFHGWLYLKVSSDEKSLRDYEAVLLEARIPLEKRIIGNRAGMVKIVGEADPGLKGPYHYRDGPELVMEDRFSDEVANWWDTTAITDGVIYTRHDPKRDPEWNTAIYVDRSRNLIYIEWDD